MGKLKNKSDRSNEWAARGFGCRKDTTTTNSTLPTVIPGEALNSFGKKGSKVYADGAENIEAKEKKKSPSSKVEPKKPLKILSKAKNPPKASEAVCGESDSLTSTTEPEKFESKQQEKSEGKRKKAKQRSYTLFVGNLSYDTTREDIFAHFHKCGYIKDVRLPLGKEDNTPRGFAYLEVEDNITYEKVLSMHHSFLKKRRINVECTFGGSKKSTKRKALIKDKTLKLRFLVKEGRISSVKQRQWGKPKDKS